MSDENAVENNLLIIDSISIDQVQRTMQKITQFQQVVQKTLQQNHDYGIIPGTPKPTMFKPGAEKILMLMGLRSEFEIVDSTRDFNTGFFQYQVKCQLYKGDMLITEGLGSANTREAKYAKQNPYTIDNTILKMAKKRALVDATLLVASLSDIFTQDIEDTDLDGQRVSNQKKYYTDQSGAITQKQAKRMFALAQGNEEIVKNVLSKYGYERSTNVQKIKYERICNDIEAAAVAEKAEPEESSAVTGDIPEAFKDAI